MRWCSSSACALVRFPRLRVAARANIAYTCATKLQGRLLDRRRCYHCFSRAEHTSPLLGIALVVVESMWRSDQQHEAHCGRRVATESLHETACTPFPKSPVRVPKAAWPSGLRRRLQAPTRMCERWHPRTSNGKATTVWPHGRQRRARLEFS